MTAEEIRNTKNSCDDGAWQSAEWLREIAAQLAEQTSIQRDDSERRRIQWEEDKANRAKQQEMMATLAGASEKMMTPPPVPPRVEFPGTVTHLGCIIREPDGAYKIATNQGQLLELAEADFQRIFAPAVPAEVKPS